MCELCNDATKAAAQKTLLIEAIKLAGLAHSLRQLANGEIDPHSREAAGICEQAKGVIRYLASEWL